MKIKKCLVVLVLFLGITLTCDVKALATEIEINEKNFPDDILREFVKEKVDLNGNGKLTDGELDCIEGIRMNNSGVSDLRGLRYFENLTSLECWETNITSIPKGEIKNLMYLDCRYNDIEELDFSGLTNLVSLDCSSCNLTSLNLRGCYNLASLICSDNKLEYLNLRGLNSNKTLSLMLNNNNLLYFEADWDCFTAYNLDGYGYQSPTVLITKEDGEYVADFSNYPNFYLNNLTPSNIAYLDDAILDYANNKIIWDCIEDIPEGFYCEYEVSDYYTLDSYVTFALGVEKIELKKKSAQITVNQDVYIDATVLPHNAANKNLKFTSENKKIATVDSYGRVTGKAPGKTKITVKACDGSGVKATFTVTVKLDKTKVKAKLVNGKSIKLTWDKVSGAYKYEVYRSTSKNSGYKKIKTTKGTTFTDKTAKRDKKYYYKIKVIAKNSDYNSKYSNIVNQKTVGKLKAPVISGKKVYNKYSKISWGKVTAAKKYEVYRSTKKGSGYKKIKTVTGTSFVDKNVKKGVTYYYKVKAIDSSTKYNSKFSGVKSVKI